MYKLWMNINGKWVYLREVPNEYCIPQGQDYQFLITRGNDDPNC